MSAGEFGGYDLAIGSIYGARQWSVDALGRLTGLSYQTIWLPGENVAECKAKRQTEVCAKGECGKEGHKPNAEGRVALGSMWWPQPRMTYGASGMMSMTLDYGYCEEVKPCDGVDPKCQCGFWAYYDDAQYNETGLRGIIKGYGKTTIGTKGFRCEKAQIVALCLPTKKKHRHDNALIRRNYPAVQFFTDYDVMLDSFPLEYEAEPTPDNDPEFWTRAASKPMDPPSHLWAGEPA